MHVFYLFVPPQDLPSLCEGLEGRSNNPVALLFDNLFHPDADLGADNPSALDWKHEDIHEISHVVLGKTSPGGTWQVRLRILKYVRCHKMTSVNLDFFHLIFIPSSSSS